MPRKRALTLLTISLLCYCVLHELNLRQPYFYTRVCHFYRDSLSRAGRLTPPNPDLVFLAIDAESVGLDPATDTMQMYGLTESKSLEGRAFSLMTQRFPWPREIYGLILERLVEAGASVVVFDLTFPTETGGDEPFRLALDRYRAHAVIGSNFVDPSWNGPSRVGASHTRPPDTIVPQSNPMDDRVAYTNFWPDEDEVVRRAQYRVTFEQVRGDEPPADSERLYSLAARAAQKMGMEHCIPDDLQAHEIRLTGAPRTAFPPHSVFEIFVPQYWQHNYRNGEFFRNKVVVVGAEGNWQHDEHQTALGLMPGPELHLNSLNAALHHEFIREMSPATVALATALAAIVALALSLLCRSPWLRLIFLTGVDVLGWLLVLQIFNRWSVYVPLVSPLCQLNLTVLFGLVTDFTQERIEKNRTRRTLERYTSRDLAAQLLDEPSAYQQSLGGVTKPVTILFSDIRGYSVVTAQREPHLLVQQLNQYLTAMVECVFRSGGTLDKFIGDAVMAVWGNIQGHGEMEDATNAVRAARAMQQELLRLNQIWKERGWPELRAGIAVHHGEVVVGNIGSPQRMEFTVIGDAVNLTWKLQEMTKEFGCPFIMSEQVHALVQGVFDLEPIGFATIASLQRPMQIFTFPEFAPGAGSAGLLSGEKDFAKPIPSFEATAGQ
jgi:adenylate cyclase